MNTDRDLVLELLRNGRLPAPLTSNPLARELAGEIVALDAQRGTATLAFTPPERFAQGAGVLQGGIITTLLDFAMAFAAHARLGADERTFATASLTVHLMRPAPPARYVARGRIVRSGRRLLFAEADLAAGSAAGVSRDARNGPTSVAQADPSSIGQADLSCDAIVARASAVLPVA